MCHFGLFWGSTSHGLGKRVNFILPFFSCKKQFIFFLVPNQWQVHFLWEKGSMAIFLGGDALRAPEAMVDAGIKVQKFLLIKVPDETLVERGCGRRLDPETGGLGLCNCFSRLWQMLLF